jgi:hypothetical protein
MTFSNSGPAYTFTFGATGHEDVKSCLLFSSHVDYPNQAHKNHQDRMIRSH